MWTPPSRRQHNRAGLRYGSDLTDAERAILAPFLPAEAGCGRKRVWPMREIVNAICYVLRGGVAGGCCRSVFRHREAIPRRDRPRSGLKGRTVYRWFARLRDAAPGRRTATIWSCVIASGQGERRARRQRSWTARASKRPRAAACGA